MLRFKIILNKVNYWSTVEIENKFYLEEKSEESVPVDIQPTDRFSSPQPHRESVCPWYDAVIVLISLSNIEAAGVVELISVSPNETILGVVGSSCFS